MALDLRAQALTLLRALAFGFALGLCYDLLRPPRRGGGRFLAPALDVLFGVLAAWAGFLYAMGAGEGRLGLWSLSCCLLGFLLYLYACSPLVAPVLAALWLTICKTMGSLKNFTKKI